MRDFTEIWQLQDTIITAVNACGYGVWDLHATSWGSHLELTEHLDDAEICNICRVLLKFWYIYVSKFEETFICKREIDALPPIIRFAVFILLTEPSRIPLFNLLAIELLMAE